MIWCSRDHDSKYRFNYEAMKNLNDDLQMRSDWTLPLCTGKERLKQADGAKAHPTQKPEGLLHRVIMSSTEVDDVVLDPFFGTGTTGAVAKKLRRNYVGMEQDEEYVRIAKERISSVKPVTDPMLVDTPSKRTQPRIPFGWLVERGMLEPGTTAKNQWCSCVTRWLSHHSWRILSSAKGEFLILHTHISSCSGKHKRPVQRAVCRARH